MSMKLRNRRILITGAASGIGLTCARMFAEEGAQVALLDRNMDATKAAALELGSIGLVADVTDEAAVAQAVQQAGEAMEGIDGVVNAAGVARIATLEDTDLATWSNVLAINLTGPYMVCRAALPWLRRANSATIVNIASGQGLLPSGTGCSYAASKGGLVILSKSLAAELAPRIRVNAVCPGRVDTPMLAPITADYDAATREAINQMYALKRMAQPEEIAAAILFLTSTDSSFITGSALAVDGGRVYH